MKALAKYTVQFIHIKNHMNLQMFNSSKIAISSDHNGIEYKNLIKQFLKERGYIVVDFGPYEEHGKVDYNFFSGLVAKSIMSSELDKGILICGTGVGMSMVANRFPDVRAVLAHNLMTAAKSREHNDSNILCLGSWVSSIDEAKQMTSVWLEEKWGEGRHSMRVNMIDAHNDGGVVLTNGVFDILHKGHIGLLKFARAQGSKLVVAIDCDELVRTRKGDDRPINSSEDRKSLLESLSFVDEVVVFHSLSELESLYEDIRPTVLVKGAEWTVDEVRTRDEIPASIQIKVFPMAAGLSTTNSIKKIRRET